MSIFLSGFTTFLPFFVFLFFLVSYVYCRVRLKRDGGYRMPWFFDVGVVVQVFICTLLNCTLIEEAASPTGAPWKVKIGVVLMSIIVAFSQLFFTSRWTPFAIKLGVALVSGVTTYFVFHTLIMDFLPTYPF